VSLLDAFRERRPFPGQDPWVVPYDGSLLLVQSAGGNRRLVIKRFDDLQRMGRNVETVIWRPSGPYANLREVWAPELHKLDGRWYVYFSAMDGRTGGHRTYALVSDDPFGPYLTLGPVGDASHDVWAIDLTVFRHGGRLYAVWSGWEEPHNGFPQNLYIAPMVNPWTIGGERRCLSRPEHDWEMTVAPVNEGPTALRPPGSGRLFLLYSVDASWTQAYKMGLLEWRGGELTDPASWRKLPRPWFTGGGHGCVVETPEGAYLVYHRKLSDHPGWADREIRSVPLAWDADGYPVVRSGGQPAPLAPSMGETSPGALFIPGAPEELTRVA
jgi:GH43 family beta-xylosidase